MTFFSGFLDKDPTPSRRRIGDGFLIVTLGFGVAQVWACRYELTPDGMDYLDIAREIAKGHWGAVANGYWGTLNSVLLAPLIRLHLSPEKELPLAHFEGILILLLAFLAFRFFLNASLDTISLNADAKNSDLSALPEWALCLLGYSLFLWSSLAIVTVSLIGPDLLVTAFIYMAAGWLLRLRRQTGPLAFAAFGLTLGVGYWAKAIMFPISLVFLLVLFFKVPRWKQNLCSVLAFALVAAPLVIALSAPRGRFTFGDSGKLNYSAFVSPGGTVIHWQGIPTASGTPKHPTRTLAVEPPIYEFNGPIPGTYPPSYDPSYWNEGHRATFNLRSQLSVIAHHVPPVIELLVVAQPSLTAGFLFLLFWNSAGFMRGLRRQWELLAISLSIVGLYMLVHFEARFVGAFVVLIWLSLFLSLRQPVNHDSRSIDSRNLDSQRIAGLSIAAAVLIMVLSFASSAAKLIVNGCPESAQSQLEMARQLPVPAGTAVAVVGAGNFSYWAHFAQLRIVADIMSPDEPEFWHLTEEGREQLYAAFRSSGAQTLIAEPPPALTGRLDTRWKQVGTTTYYYYPLHP
ncbi:MAG TPA: hypothetical protein VK828_01355 [Terriglobales bacterium]|jgi:hypothetical protein|nr:hypothetical protein [Terriglobales bacterium]